MPRTLPLLALLALLALLLWLPTAALSDTGGARYEQTPYGEQKVVFDFYFDTPAKINTALHWLRSYMNPLTAAPYDQAPEFMDIKVIIHGTEIVTVARHNEKEYQDAVDRMRYYAQLGVEFRVCELAAHDYGYQLEDFQDYIVMAPSAMVELAHWQLQGYALITPQVLERTHSIESIR